MMVYIPIFKDEEKTTFIMIRMEFIMIKRREKYRIKEGIM